MGWDRIRRGELAAPAADVKATLTYYPPGLVQPDHGHGDPHISLVLTGGFEEAAASGRTEARPGDLLQRRQGHSHHVTYGRHGALIVTLQPGAGDPSPPEVIPARARPEGPAAGETPTWLLAARAALLEDPAGQSIAHLAARFGVHRVHFSRAFRDHFGVRPSVVRRDAMVSHALALALGQEEPLAACAQASGFADQAHLTRAVKAVCGLPPARLRQLLA